MKELLFKQPPAKEVQIDVRFPYNLSVADSRGVFHRLVRERFPVVIMPDRAKLEFDLGDYSLYSQNFSERLEIAMGSFRLVTSSYPGFAPFREAFASLLSTFCTSYEISVFTNLAFRYHNQCPVPDGNEFNDCFALQIVVPEEIQANSFAGKGMLIFQQPEGYVVIEFEPQLKETVISSYHVNLSFAAQKTMSLKELLVLIDAGHAHLRRYFAGILGEEYLSFLKGLAL